MVINEGDLGSALRRLWAQVLELPYDNVPLSSWDHSYTTETVERDDVIRLIREMLTAEGMGDRPDETDLHP